MPQRSYANAPATTLAGSCTALATTISLTSVTGLPLTYPYTLILDRGTATEEVVDVTAAAGTTLTVTRGVDGTTAFAHASGAAVVHGVTARDLREVNTHANATSGVHGVSGDLVGATQAQTLTNKTLVSPVLTGNPTAPTPATSDSDTTLATTAFVKAVFLAMNPVGTIVSNVTGTNPGTYLGGTWVAWGSGRVPVGIDSTQTEFNEVEKTGGEKTHVLTEAEIPAHTHSVSPGVHSEDAGGLEWSLQTSGGSDVNIKRHATLSAGSTGGGQAHNNLQPYITCYMFKRTA